MEGKFFLLDQGHVAVRDSDGIEIGFSSVDEFYKHYSGTIDLSNEYYIGYQPDNHVFYYKNDPKSIEPLTNQYETTPFVQEYEDVIADAVNMKAKKEDPFFGLQLEEVRDLKMNMVKTGTYQHIIQRMPEWKQFRWSEYMKLHERLQAGDTLNLVEQMIYDGFPNEGQTHEICYDNCVKAFKWMVECIAQNDVREREIVRLTTIEELIALAAPDYPQWEL